MINNWSCLRSCTSKAYYVLYSYDESCKHSAVATICDPRMNHTVFKKIYPNTIDDTRRSRARAQFEDVCRTYQKREYHLDTERINRETALIEAIGATNTTEQEPDSDEDLFASEGLAFQEPEWRRWMLEPIPSYCSYGSRPSSNSSNLCSLRTSIQ
jgi:hypothetical protein